MKRIITAILCLALLLSVLPGASFAVEAGDRYAPDASQWGTQNNNGWYYLYRDGNGEYHEMDYYTESTIDWQRGNFASDPNTLFEMFFISPNTLFVGELGSRPAYGFQAPASGEVVLTMQTHSTSEMHMQVFVGDKLQKIGGEDSLTLTTAGTLPGGMTKTELNLQVKAGEMIYVEFYSTNTNVQRQAWINEYAVKYLSIEEELTGSVFAPDMANWGKQGNNGWYYMSKDGNGYYSEMQYFDETSTIDWQRNAYASDPFTQYEMFFINQTTFFTGELGTLPVYAFKAPVGGEIKLCFETHGVDCLYYQIFVDEDLKQDKTAFTTAGTLEGGFTATELTLNIKKNEMIYIVCGTTGTERGGWLRNYSVEYLSTNDEVDYTAVNYAPNMNAWGIQNNNGWYYMYQHGNTGLYGLLDFYDETATIDWQRNRYAFDPYSMGEMLFIEPNHFFTGELGSKPVYAFKAPVGGEVEIYFEIHGLSDMGVSAYVGDELVQIEGKDRYTFVTTGSLPGAFTAVSFTCDVAAGDMVYLVCSTTSAMRDGWFRNQRAKYLSVNGEVADPDDPTEEEKPMVEGSAAEWNKTTDYYAQLQEKLASDEPMTWLFVGDSITANDGDVGRGYRNYSEIFESYLKGTLGRVNDRVVNTAVSGWKVSNINYERDIAAYNPDVVYVKVGTNDTFLTDYAAANFLASMGNLYDKIIAGGAIPVVAAANGFSGNWGNVAQTEAFALRYPNTIRTLAYEKKLLFVDYFSVYGEDPAFSDSYFFCPDTIHPNRAGFLVHAQTFIRDLGLDREPALMAQDVETLFTAEQVEKMLLSELDPAAYIFDTEGIVDLNMGFVMVGGVDAVGANQTMMTTRSIHQYLNNNNQLGRNETLYISLADAKAMDYSVYAEGKAVLLMPEAYGLDGETLWAGATAEDIAEVVAKIRADGRDLILITPADGSGAGLDLAEAVRSAAETASCGLIDLNMYFGASISLNAELRSQWYDGTALNYAGANDAAMMIGLALGLDPISYSDNRFLERFDPAQWGNQGADGFYYLYQSKSGGDYVELPFVPSENAPASWVANRYSLAVDEYTFIGQDVIHAGANYNPVKAFKVPYSGTVRVTLKHRRGVADVSEGGDAGTMWLKAFVNNEAVAVDGENEKIALLLDFGRYNTTCFETEVKAGDMIYVMVDAEVPGQCDVLETITYIALEEDGEVPCTHAHTEIRDAKAATCTEAGYTGDTYCSLCGEKIAEGEVIAALGHGATEIRNAAEATCTEAGYTGDSYCTVCGEKLAEGEVVPALGHSFEDGFCTVCGAEDPNYLPSNPFTDVKESDYYYAPVLWAVQKGITNGTTPTTFSPEDPCTRGQIVTFLWRAFGSPEPTKTDNPFTDVAESMYYYKAVLWAVEQGITTGTSATTFSPEDTCTRGQVATFLWRACGKPAPESSENPFSDVPEAMYYYEPILWAVEEGVTNGTGNGEFSPDDSCTRGQIVTFLYRALAK